MSGRQCVTVAVVAVLGARAGDARLLLDEAFTCADIGCNATQGITNYSYWRWSTTGSAQTHMAIVPAAAPRTGNEVDFSVTWCPPPDPNPKHLGCYRSELALNRDQGSPLVDWKRGVGTSERWFGFSNRLLNFSFDGVGGTQLNGPSFQLHGGGGLPALKSGHPNLNLQVDSTGCAAENRSCPVWTLEVSNAFSPGNPRCSESYQLCWVLGPALGPDDSFEGWNDWVIRWRGSPQKARGHVQVWRGGKVVLPLMTGIATAYNDTVPPYPKFGVYRGSWKGATKPTVAKTTAIAYAAFRVGDETSSFDEVSTAIKF